MTVSNMSPPWRTFEAIDDCDHVTMARNRRWNESGSMGRCLVLSENPNRQQMHVTTQ